MTGYRRNFVAGGFFFTVNLADRRQQLLTENVDALRTALRETKGAIHCDAIGRIHRFTDW